jgi:tetratricopeptide (TPR) repeat protein
MQISGPSPHLRRAELLIDQRRHDLAEKELRQVIAEEPNQAYAYALLAHCLLEREQWQAATDAARQAVGLDPSDPYLHYTLALTYHLREMQKEASSAIDEALRINPEVPDCWSLRAGIHVSRKEFRAAVEAAERGLAIDGQHEGCVNLRAMALTNLGERQAAGSAIGSTLARNPLNPVSHANMGWNLLHSGDPRRAMEHFREALRLDPGMEWARAGILEAMKARSPIYRVFLRYFLFMSRLSSQAQLAIIVGLFVGYQLLRQANNLSPVHTWYLVPLIIAYVAFAIGTIVAVPLFNLLLFTSRFGRLVLNRRERWGAAIFGLSLAPPVIFLLLWAGTGNRDLGAAALFSAFLAIPVALAGLLPSDVQARGRIVMIGLASILAVLCALLIWLILTDQPPGLLMLLYVLGCFGSTWIANMFALAPAQAKG